MTTNYFLVSSLPDLTQRESHRSFQGCVMSLQSSTLIPVRRKNDKYTAECLLPRWMNPPFFELSEASRHLLRNKDTRQCDFLRDVANLISTMINGLLSNAINGLVKLINEYDSPYHSFCRDDDEFTRAGNDECRWSHNLSVMGIQRGFGRKSLEIWPCQLKSYFWIIFSQTLEI